MTSARVLVVDDEAVIRDGLKRILEGESFVVDVCSSGYSALEELQKRRFDLIITDLKMPGMSGIDVLKSVRTFQPHISVILITGYASVDTAVEAMKSGAFDYISKPFVPDLLLEKVHSALSQRTASLDDICFTEEVSRHHGFHRFIGESKEMQKVYHGSCMLPPQTAQC
jgi:DNA-binding NtrC family response regulator